MPRKEDTLMEKLKRESYTKDTPSIAKELIGCTLVSTGGEGAAAAQAGYKRAHSTVEGYFAGRFCGN